MSITIADPAEQKDVVDYEFNFLGGTKHPLIIHPDLGDSVDDTDPACYKIHLQSKPSLFDEKEILPSEDITINKANTLYVIVKKRKMAIPSKEQLYNLQLFLKGLKEPADVQ